MNISGFKIAAKNVKSLSSTQSVIKKSRFVTNEMNVGDIVSFSNTVVNNKTKSKTFEFAKKVLGRIKANAVKTVKADDVAALRAKLKADKFPEEGINAVLGGDEKLGYDSIKNVLDRLSSGNATLENVVTLAKSVTKENKNVVEKAVSRRDSGNHFFDSLDNINDFVQKITPDNSAVLIKALDRRLCEGGIYRDLIYHVGEFGKQVNSTNSQIADKMLSRKAKNGGYVDDLCGIRDFIANVNEDNLSVANKMIERKDKNGEYDIFGMQLRELAENLSSEKTELVGKLVDKKGSNGKYLYVSDDIIDVVDSFDREIQEKPETFQYKKEALVNLLSSENSSSIVDLKNISETVNSKEDLQKFNALLDKKLSPYQIHVGLTSKEESLKQTAVQIKDWASVIKSEEEIYNQIIDKDGKNATICKLLSKRMFGYKSENPTLFNKIYDSEILKLLASGRKDLDIDLVLSYNKNFMPSDKLLREAKAVANGESGVKSLPLTAGEEDFIKQVPNGEVGTVGNNLFVNENGKMTPLMMTKEKFEELFPLIDRSNFKQGARSNDCWLISALDNLMNLPLGRSKLYKLFRQQGNDIYIKFPNNTKEVRFKDSMLMPGTENMSSTVALLDRNKATEIEAVHAPLGIKMLEQAYSIHRFRNYSTSLVTDAADVKNVKKQLSALDSGFSKDAVMVLTGCKGITFLSGEGLSLKSEMQELIKKFANDENVAVFGSAEKNQVDKVLSDEYYLHSRHEYSIKAFDEATGMCQITNPWETGKVVEVPIAELMKYFNTVEVVKLNSTAETNAASIIRSGFDI